MARRRTVTLQDVAELAGVSAATASKALNGRDRVSSATRARVQLAARDLAFAPVHTPPTEGLPGTIGLLTSDLMGRFSLPILIGAEDMLASGELSVFLCDARGDAVRERHHLAALRDRQVAGLIVVGFAIDARDSVRHSVALPTVYAYQPSSNANDISIVPDNFGGGRLVAEHLIATGRRRIVHISGPHHEAATSERGRGMRAALEDADLRFLAETGSGEWSEQWGRTAIAMLLARYPDTDAVICDSDRIARGALDGLKARDIDVPRTVAITGFDNWDILAEGASPQLTSVDMDLERIGQVAARTLFDVLTGTTTEPGIRTEPCRLVVRGSTVAEL